MAKELSNMLVNRIHDQHLQRFASPLVTEHVGVDHAGTARDLDRADLVGTAYALVVARKPLAGA